MNFIYEVEVPRSDNMRGRISRLKGNVLATIIYWIVLIIFLHSYLTTSNPLSLSVVADRVLDALSISLVFLVNWITKKPLNEHYSYGFHRVETLMNVSVIMAFLALAAYSAINTTMLFITHTKTPAAGTLYASAVSVPLLIIATLFMEKHESSNFRAIFLHSLQDVAIVLMALAFSIVALYSSLYYVDYLGNYIVLFIIIYGNRKIFSRNITMLMEGTVIDIKAAEDSIKNEFPNVHHLHIWDICQHQRLATLHLKVPPGQSIGEIDEAKKEIENILSKYGVTHLTIQSESEEAVDR